MSNYQWFQLTWWVYVWKAFPCVYTTLQPCITMKHPVWRYVGLKRMYLKYWSTCLLGHSSRMLFHCRVYLSQSFDQSRGGPVCLSLSLSMFKLLKSLKKRHSKISVAKIIYIYIYSTSITMLEWYEPWSKFKTFFNTDLQRRDIKSTWFHHCPNSSNTVRFDHHAELTWWGCQPLWQKYLSKWVLPPDFGLDNMVASQSFLTTTYLDDHPS